MSGLTSMLFWVTTFHVTGALHGKVVTAQKKEAKAGCKVNCAFDFEFSDEAFLKMKGDVQKLLAWLKKVLYCENPHETAILLGVLFFLRSVSQQFSNRYS